MGGILDYETPTKKECFTIIEVQTKEYAALLLERGALVALLESAIEFTADQLALLPTHEHNDPVLKRMEADMSLFIESTQDKLISFS